MGISGENYQENQDIKSIWHNCLAKLRTEYDSHIFQSFIEPLELSAYNPATKKLVINAPTDIIKKQVLRRYSQVIFNSLSQSLDSAIRIDFTVTDKSAKDSVEPIIISKAIELPTKIEDSNNESSGVSKATFTKTNLNPAYTFENFIIGKSNELAALAARRLAENESDNTPLFFYGSSGLGKTHLMQAIGNHYLSLNPTARVYYTSSENFTNKLVAAIRAGKVEKFKQQIRTIDLLLMDEIQFLANKKHTQEEFLHTFNSLLSRGSKIALIADRMPKQLESIDEKLKNRFSWGVAVDFGSPDFETRVKVLEMKAKAKNLKIQNDAIQAIAREVRDNIRELEGVINRLTVMASLRKESVDLTMAETVINQINKPKLSEVSYREIKSVTAHYFDLKVSDLESKRRLKRISYARQIAIYLIRKHTSIPYLEIGLHFGSRDHSSIIYSANKIEKELKIDQKLEGVVRELERQFL